MSSSSVSFYCDPRAPIVSSPVVDSPIAEKIFVYKGNGETKVFTSLENLNKFLLEKHGETYNNYDILARNFSKKSCSYELWSNCNQ